MLSITPLPCSILGIHSWETLTIIGLFVEEVVQKMKKSLVGLCFTSYVPKEYFIE